MRSSLRVSAIRAIYAGTHVFASFDPLSKKDLQLRRFLNVMDGFPGYDVVVKERKPQHHLRCPNDGCRLEIRTCPHCGQEIRRTVEKGVDTALVTDIIRLGIDNHYDRAILIAGDADHIPAMEFLGSRLKQGHACVVQGKLERASQCVLGPSVL